MSAPWRARRPWPWDAELDVGDGFVGLMLVPDQDGLLVARRTNPLANVQPTSFEYGSYPPDVESTFVFGRLVGGMGEHIQSSSTSKRYRYADKVDCSIAGLPRLGPLFTDETFPGLPAAVFPGQNDVRQFVVGPQGAGRALFALVRDHAYVRDAGTGTWTLSRDFGAGAAPQQAVVFTGTAGGAGLWVATATGQLWKYDGAAWTQAVLPTVAGGAPADVFAERVEVVGHSLYVGSGSTACVCNAGDPLVAASWGGAILVGNPATRISYLRAVHDTLYVFKWDGLHTLNADGSDNDLFPELRAQPMVGNGRGAVAWRDRAWFRYGEAVYSVDAGGTLVPVGPERLVENHGPVRGRFVAACGHADWFLYGAVHNDTTATSYLLKYGTWTASTDPTAPAAHHFDDVWNGALASWAGKEITRLDAIAFDTDLDPTADGPALWVGFRDGTVAWTPLPRLTPDPVDDPRCRFVPSGTVYAPLHDQVFGADRKAFHAGTALATFLNEEQDAALRYRTDPTAPYATLVPAFQASGQRLPLPDLTDGAPRDASTGFQLDFGVELRTTTSTRTPVLEGLALHEAIRPNLHLVWSFTVNATNRVVRRDGVVSARTAEAIRLLLRQAAAAPGHTRLRTPDEVVGGFAFLDYREQLAPDRGRDGLAWRIAVTAGQFRPP